MNKQNDIQLSEHFKLSEFTKYGHENEMYNVG